MKHLAALLALLAIVFLVGCAKKSPIVGTWEASQPPMTLVYHFEGDGSFTQDVSGQTPVGDLKMKVAGTYEFKDKQLTIKNPKIESLSGIPKDKEAIVRKMAEAQVNQSLTATVEFKGDNEATVSQNGQSLQFKRK